MISELDHPNDYFVLAMIQYVKEALILKYERCDIRVQKIVSLQSHYLTPRSLWWQASHNSLYGRTDSRKVADLCHSAKSMCMDS